MTPQDLIIFNDTTYASPKTQPFIEDALLFALRNNRKLKTKGYEVVNISIDVRTVYTWLTGVKSLPGKYNIPISLPCSPNPNSFSTAALLNINKEDPYPVILKNGIITTKSVQVEMLKHIYAITGILSEDYGRIIKKMIKKIIHETVGNQKNIIILSFEPLVSFIGDFIASHLNEDINNMFTLTGKRPAIVKLSTIEFKDAQNRRNMIMRNNDISISYGEPDKRVYKSHVFFTPYLLQDSKHSSRRTRHTAVTSSIEVQNEYILDLSEVDYKKGLRNNITPASNNVPKETMIQSIVKEFNKEQKLNNFVDNCISMVKSS